MKRVVVGTDFSAGSQPVIDAALEQVKAFGGRLILMHAVEPDLSLMAVEEGTPEMFRATRADRLKAEHREMQAQIGRLKEAGYDVVGMLIDGPTTTSLLEKAREHDADLIVLGAHRHGVWYRLFFGSVAGSMVKRTTLPLLVVPIVDEA